MLVLEDDAGQAALLAGDVQERLEDLGIYRREGRPWLPHLTVARWNVRRLDGARQERKRACRWSSRRLRLGSTPPVRTFVPSDAAAYLSGLHPAGRSTKSWNLSL